jgi:hypothetical protein
VERELVPQKSWYLIFNSTLKGCVSYRSKKDGSFFVQVKLKKTFSVFVLAK